MTPYHVVRVVRHLASATIRLIAHVCHPLLQEISSVQPAGPYILAGYSFGTCVAIEIAKQLVSNGQTVSQLFLFDGSHSDVSVAATQRFNNTSLATGSQEEKETEALLAFCSLHTTVDSKPVNFAYLS